MFSSSVSDINKESEFEYDWDSEEERQSGNERKVHNNYNFRIHSQPCRVPFGASPYADMEVL